LHFFTLKFLPIVVPLKVENYSTERVHLASCCSRYHCINITYMLPTAFLSPLKCVRNLNLPGPACLIRLRTRSRNCRLIARSKVCERWEDWIFN